MRNRPLTLLGAALLLAASAAQAANPRITLSVSEARLPEVLTALGKAAGVPLDLYSSPASTVIRLRRADGLQDERASFTWNNVPFAQALREVCGKYHLRPSRTNAGYTLYPQAAAAPLPLPARLTGLYEKEGFRLFAKSISVYQNDRRSLDFVGNGANNNGTASMSLALQGLWETGDTDAIAGLQNVVAKDDRGTLLESRANGGALVFISDLTGTYPDEWSTNLTFDTPHPAAKKLASVEGDLFVYRSVKRLHAEVPVPYEGKYARANLGDQTLIVSGYKLIPKEEPEEEDLNIPGLPGPGPQFLSRNNLHGPSFRIRTFGPPEANPGLRLFRSSRSNATPFAVGASGKLYRSQSTGGFSSWSNNGIQGTDTTLIFPGMEEPVVKLVWDTVQKEDPVKLFTFRLTDIPLPAGAGLPVPLPNRKPQLRPLPADARPFFDADGGTLTTRVVIAGKPVTEGTLALGLAEKNGGSFRWVNVDIQPDGTARLENLKPGAYRLMRVYRPKAGAPTGPGRWTDAELTVQITADKETAAAPLAWIAGTAPDKPKPPVLKGKPR